MAALGSMEEVNVSVYERLRRSPLGVRVTRYTLGSIVAAATSAIVFALTYLLGVPTTTCSIVAFVAGAIPNWVLNRSWAWQVSGRIAVGREVIAYIAVSVLSLVATSATTAWTAHHVRTIASHDVRAVLVTAAYLAVFAVLFVAKFAVYELWIFSGRSRVRAALRSRRQVWIAARANRTP
jgi:putative flippase GtrA